MVRGVTVLFTIIISQAIAYCTEPKVLSKGSETMILVETKRTAIRAFKQDDWADVHTLANDWSKAPGPAFDKWPTDEAGTKGMLDLFINNGGQYHAIFLRESRKVIGLISLTINDKKQGEIGHVILGKYQDTSIDKEALKAIVDYAFNSKGVLSIVTHNAPEHKEQIAPLISLGFRNTNAKDPGELIITKAEWEKLSKGEKAMDTHPKIVEKAALYFVGIEKAYSADNFDPGYQQLWFHDFMPRRSEIEKYAVDKAHYALEMRNPNVKNTHTYMVALRTEKQVSAPPEGFVDRISAKGLFVEFPTTVEKMGAMIPDWFKNNPAYEERIDAYRIEYYPPETQGTESNIYMWVPIKRKTQ